jgi:thioredoxin-dependent peroxiredoxin
VALSLNNDQATEKYGALDIKLPYLRMAKAPR